MKLLITNIDQLINVRAVSKVLRGKEMAELPVIRDAYLWIEHGLIREYGEMSALKPHDATEVFDAAGASILPSWCDSHTHLVFAAGREDEFVDKIKGKSYAEIAANGGGILNSARKLNAMTEDALFELACNRLSELIRLGTGAIEIKSGYGLSTEGELKMLRVIQRLKKESPIPIKVSFLGAHTYPAVYKDNHQGYINEIIHQMLPAIKAEGLACLLYTSPSPRD